VALVDIETAEKEHIPNVARGVFVKKKHDTHDYKGREG